jgi:hypothetical protein
MLSLIRIIAAIVQCSIRGREQCELSVIALLACPRSLAYLRGRDLAGALRFRQLVS